MFGINKTLLNICLLVGVLFLLVAIYSRWNRELPALPEAVIQPKQQKKETLLSSSPKGLSLPGLGHYKAITQRNLFSPERKEYIAKFEGKEQKNPEQTSKVVRTVRVSGKDIVFYGVVTTGKEVRALIHNPISSESRKSQWVTKGEKIGDLTVTEIKADKIVFNGKDGNLELRLRDTSRKKRSQMRGSVKLAEKKTSPVVVKTKTPSAPVKATADSVKKADQKKGKVIHTPFGIIRQ